MPDRFLRIAPHDHVRATGEAAAVHIADSEHVAETFAVVLARNQILVAIAIVEGVVRDTEGIAGLDVHQRLALGEVLSRVDVEVVAPEHVLVRDVAGQRR